MLIKFKLYLCIVPVCTTYDKLVKHSLHNEQYIGYLYVEFAVYGYGVCELYAHGTGDDVNAKVEINVSWHHSNTCMHFF